MYTGNRDEVLLVSPSWTNRMQISQNGHPNQLSTAVILVHTQDTASALMNSERAH